jgi:hypothetical protein
MSPLRLMTIALALGAGSAAMAGLPRLAGRTILSGCRQGECRWLQALSFDSAGTVLQGELRRMKVRVGTSTHLDGKIPVNAARVRIDWAPGVRAQYAFCSRLRPAFAFEDEEGKLVVHFLDLFDLAGYQYNSAELYMRLCHGASALPPPRALRALGYRAKTRSAQVEARGPEIMTRF